jgi:hypothetical protein
MPFRITAFAILLLLSSTAWAQRKATVFGIVRDSSNAVLEDVNVAGVGKSFGTITAKDGSFVLTVPSEETFQLAFSFVGRNTIYLEIAALQPGTSKTGRCSDGHSNKARYSGGGRGSRKRKGKHHEH